MNVAEAHRHSQGEDVIVAVIDTGVKADHRDLTGNILPGADFTGENTRGHKDVNGHGTSMAGLIAARGHGPRNSEGVIGVAPRAKVLPIRTRQEAIGNSANLPAAIRYAVSHGATVLSMSLSTGPIADLRRALQEALDADVVVVAGSGNRPGSVSIGYPAAYPGVVAVGATGRDGKIAPVTVTGDAMVLTAPGVDIASTSNTGAYQFATGTSDATAIVAGAAALVRAKYPKLSATEVVHRLTATATDKGRPGRDPQYGYGVINLVAALTADVPPAPPPTATAGPAPTTPAATEQQSAPAAAAPPGDSGPAFRLSGAFFVVIGLVLLAVLVVIGIVVWRLTRRGSRVHRPPWEQVSR